MNKTALLLGVGAGLMLAASAASAASPCSAEISAIEQAMGNVTVAPSAPGVQNPDPGAAASATPNAIPDATTGATTGTTSDTTGATTGTMTGTTPDTTTSTIPDSTTTTDNATGATTGTPEVGTMPAPTVTETSRAGEITTSASGREAALVALAKAKNFAAAGQEEACMTEVGTAKTALGIQ